MRLFNFDFKHLDSVANLKCVKMLAVMLTCRSVVMPVLVGPNGPLAQAVYGG